MIFSIFAQLFLSVRMRVLHEVSVFVYHANQKQSIWVKKETRAT